MGVASALARGEIVFYEWGEAPELIFQVIIPGEPVEVPHPLDPDLVAFEVETSEYFTAPPLWCI